MERSKLDGSCERQPFTALVDWRALLEELANLFIEAKTASQSRLRDVPTLVANTTMELKEKFQQGAVVQVHTYETERAFRVKLNSSKVEMRRACCCILLKLQGTMTDQIELPHTRH